MAVCHIKMNHKSRRCCVLCSPLRRRRHQRWLKNLQNWIKFQHSWSLRVLTFQCWWTKKNGSEKYSNVSLSWKSMKWLRISGSYRFFVALVSFFASLYFFTPSKIQIPWYVFLKILNANWFLIFFSFYLLFKLYARKTALDLVIHMHLLLMILNFNSPLFWASSSDLPN